MRVVFASGIDEFCHRYGPLHWAEQLATQGIASTVRAHTDGRLSADLESHDVLVLYRVPWSPWIDYLRDQARALGRAVVFAVDDLVVSPEIADIPSLRRATAEERALWSDGVARYRRTLETCDAFLATTEPLAEVGRALGIATYVHRAGLAARELALGTSASAAARSDGSLRLGYFSGTTTHTDDLATIVPVLADFLTRHGTAELLLAGHVAAEPTLAAFGGRVRSAPYVAWTDLPRLVAGVDVSLAPLEWQHPFVAAKGAIKYLEAAAVAAPVIASPTEGYRHTIDHGVTGFLADGAAEWSAALEACAADPARRAAIGRAARRDVEMRFAPEPQGIALAAIFAEIASPRTTASAAVGEATTESSPPASAHRGGDASKKTRALRTKGTKAEPGVARPRRRSVANDPAIAEVASAEHSAGSERHTDEIALAARFPGEVMRTAREPADWPALAPSTVTAATEPLVAGAVLTRSFSAAGPITRLDVWTVTYGQRFDHTIEARLVDDTGRTLALHSVPAALVPDRAWLALELATDADAGGEARPSRYTLELRAHGTGEANALSFGIADSGDGGLALRVFGTQPSTSPDAADVLSTSSGPRERPHVLVICPDTTGPMMAGTAIRSVEIARALAADCAVTLAVPNGSTHVDVDLPQVRVPGDAMLPPLIEAADVVIVAGRAELMSAIRKPLIVDLYDPFILSDLEFYGAKFNAAGGRPLLALRWLQHHLENGDLFLCASEVQRSFWLGMLAAAGRVNRANYAGDQTLGDLLAVVPFGIPDTPPVATRPTVKGVIPGIERDDRVVLWAGGLWNWVDPLTLIRAIATLTEVRPAIKALFLGMRHPNPDIGEMAMAGRARALAAELGVEGRNVFFVDWVPYGERQNYLLESDIGVSLHQPGVESQYAFRTRVLDYLWCGVPMVLSRGDDLATRVEREQLGVAVPEGDHEAVAAAIVALLASGDSPERRARFAAVRRELSWENVIEPVRRFCRAPRLAADKTSAPWFAAATPTATVLRKEDALIADEHLTTARELSPPLGQYYAPSWSFVAAYDNLCRIDVLPWLPAPPPAVDLVFTVTDDQLGRELARVTMPFTALPHNDWHRFEFRPIPNSGGRRYRLAIEVPALRSNVNLWLCNRDGEELGDPLFVAQYLVKGVIDEVPVDHESFLFLHNTTVSEGVVPGIGATMREADFRASALIGDAATAGLGAATPGSAAPGSAAPDPSRSPDADDAASNGHGEQVRADLARLTAALAVTRRELRELAALHAAGPTETRVLPRLGRELLRLAAQVAQGIVALGVRALVLLLAAATVPFVLVLAAALAATDLLVAIRRRRGLPPPQAETATGKTGPRLTQPVSVVIPTWNGRALLEMSLPPLRAALRAHAPGGEIVVVDNGSSDDTREFLAVEFPEVRVIALATNEGFAGASNRGVRESRSATVILLNNDMVVEPDFVAPLLEALDAEPEAFGVSCQIDFIDKGKPRWETGKVHAKLKYGAITLFHLENFEENLLYPVFFAGGGASAYDRAKFLALEGFDEAVFSPVYIEDVDLGYRAWKRGWPSLFQPKSVVHHKHRGTTRRLWSEGTIHSFFVKNLAALMWKNVSSWRLLVPHLCGLVLLPLRVFRNMGARAALATWKGLVRQTPTVLRARLREGLAPRVLDDETIFFASRYRYAYRAQFGRRPARAPGARPRLLIISPYSPYPAVHGGAVRMLALLQRLARQADVSLLTYGDTPAELAPRSIAALRELCRDVAVIERPQHSRGGILQPDKARAFWSREMVAMVEEFLDRDDYDLVQAEYTHMAHLLPPRTRGLVRILVEHDVSFVSLARSLATARGALRRLGLRFEWMRMFRYEIDAVERADLVFTMSDTDRAALGRFVDTRHTVTIPNGVDCRRFRFVAEGREPRSILFVGFFRHEPNVEAVRYFCAEVLPLVRHEVADVRFRAVGAYPPEVVRALADADAVEVTGLVDDIRPYYETSSVFVAPVLQGSGTRLKILEAMASGCPVVSTTVGAEGLGATDGVEIRIGDSPQAMASAIVALLRDPAASAALATRARAFVGARYDWDAIVARLLACYRDALDLPARRAA